MLDLLLRLVEAALADPPSPPAPAEPAPEAPLKRRRLLRQGDVLLIEIDELPSGTSLVSRVPRETGGDRVVLAYGEVTGHAHAIDETHVEARERDGRMYLRIEAPATLRHEEHSALELSPGHYEVRRQREFEPRLPDRTRQVID